MTQTKTIQEPDLSSTLEQAKRDLKVGFNSIQIGQIEEFDAARQIATIKILLKQVINIAPDGTRTLQERPLILECPVMTNFGGASHINLPIVKGDNCIVLFCDREIDNWLYNGGVQVPTTQRTHDISDAIAIVGLRDLRHSIQNFLADGIRIWFAANSHMDFTDDAITSLASLFTHHGDFRVNGDFYVTGDVYGENGAALTVRTDIIQESGYALAAGNGATGGFNFVNVVDGIVVSGS